MGRLFPKQKGVFQEIGKYGAKKGNYDSNLEEEFKGVLISKGLVFTEQPEFVILPKFDTPTETITEVRYRGDFRVGDTIYDVKGVKTESFRLKEKMFKYSQRDLKLVCICKIPDKWAEDHIKSSWLTYEELKRYNRFKREFKKKHGLKRVTKYNVTQELIEKIKTLETF